MDPVESSRLLQNPQKSKIFKKFLQKIRKTKIQKQKQENKSPGPPGLLLDPKVLPASQIFSEDSQNSSKITKKIQENPQNPRNQKGHPKKDEPSEPTTNQQPDVLSKDRRPPRRLSIRQP
jgi:hypothetical protein